MSELENKIEDVAKNVADYQAKYDEVGDKIDALDKSFLEKAAKHSTELLAEFQEIKIKQEAGEKERKELEKAIFRMPASGAKKTEHSEYRDGFNKYLRKGTAISHDVCEEVAKSFVSDHYFGLDESQKEFHAKELVAGINPQGGYWIRPERSQKIVSRMFETSPMRSVAAIETTTSDSMEFIIDDNEAASGGWVGELDSRGDTGTPDIGLLTIPVAEQFAQPVATQKMIDDSGFDIEGWLQRKVSDKLTRTENTAFVTGDGSKKPKGFLDYAAWASPGVYERNAIEQIASGSATLLTADGLIDLQMSLKEAYQGNAVFMTKRASFADIMKLKDQEDQYLLNPRVLSESADMILLGKTLRFADDMEAVGSGALSVVYGDFGLGYTIVDRFGFRVIRDDITTKGKVKFYTTKRVGGAVTNYEALKIQVVSV